MAYIREISEFCRRCPKQTIATFEVFNRTNASCGRYCKKHAEAKLRELQQTERESDKALGER